METLLIETLTQETASLREQLSLLESRAAAIRQTLDSMEQRLSDLQAAQQACTAPPAQEDELPEIEVELIVNEDDEDEPAAPVPLPDATPDDLLTAEEQQVEESVEDVLVSEIEKEPAAASAPEAETEAPEAEAPAKEAAAKAEPHTGVTLPHVDDIRRAISLGDRFLFQRELFQGDGEKMNKTIDQLNRLGSLEEAMQYIKKKFNWDSESQAYELFTNILRRRY